jgi:hypothetical protein
LSSIIPAGVPASDIIQLGHDEYPCLETLIAKAYQCPALLRLQFQACRGFSTSGDLDFMNGLGITHVGGYLFKWEYTLLREHGVENLAVVMDKTRQPKEREFKYVAEVEKN